MAALQRVRMAWSGFPGGPGVSTFYALDATTLLTPLRVMAASMEPRLPLDVSLVVEPTGDIIESTTGEITGSWTGSTAAGVTGTSSGAYSAPTGFVTEWLTELHLSGRLLRGRTFWVPAGGAVFANDGTIDSPVLTDMRIVAALFVSQSAGNLAVWQRPRKARAADGSRPAVLARGGGHGIVTSSRVPDKAVVLRSRRQ